jgi:hypothetical protein
MILPTMRVDSLQANVEPAGDFLVGDKHALVASPSYLDFTNKALFGKITSLGDGANDPREIELALKFY